VTVFPTITGGLSTGAIGGGIGPIPHTIVSVSDAVSPNALTATTWMTYMPRGGTPALKDVSSPRLIGASGSKSRVARTK
jgi:hypothetical protein